VKVATAANFIFHLQQGARKGAPTALQVADRFHLFVNLSDALKRLFERKYEALQEEASQQQGISIKLRAIRAASSSHPVKAEQY